MAFYISGIVMHLVYYLPFVPMNLLNSVVFALIFSVSLVCIVLQRKLTFCSSRIFKIVNGENEVSCYKGANIPVSSPSKVYPTVLNISSPQSLTPRFLSVELHSHVWMITIRLWKSIFSLTPVMWKPSLWLAFVCQIPFVRRGVLVDFWDMENSKAHWLNNCLDKQIQLSRHPHTRLFE